MAEGAGEHRSADPSQRSGRSVGPIWLRQIHFTADPRGPARADPGRSALPWQRSSRFEPWSGDRLPEFRLVPVDDGASERRGRAPRRGIFPQRLERSSGTGDPDGGPGGLRGRLPTRALRGDETAVGMARAFSLNPEMLFMDEPFSQVDALTAESLRAEVIDIWTAKDKKTSSILIVSHDIKEVVYMADRIIVMGAHPGVMRKMVENTLPRPRDYRSPALLQLVDHLHDIITGIEMPDVPAATAAGAPAIEPLPAVSVGEILGLLEYLDARGGQEDVFRIASDTQREFGTVISVVNAAEMLDFVETPKRLVRLAPEGTRMVRAPIADRKVLWRQRILTLGLFQQVLRAIERSPEGRVTKEFVLENIVLAMPLENYEAIFDTFVKWGRFADLFDYDEEREVFRAFSESEGGTDRRQSGTG